MTDVNIWIFPKIDEILVTDQTGGVPADCCGLPEYETKRLERLLGSGSVLYQFKDWNTAVDYAQSLLNKLPGWTIEYDSAAGRDLANFTTEEYE